MDLIEGVDYKEIYDSMKNSIIDIASMEENGMNDMKSFIYNQGEDGDLLRLNVSIKNGESLKNEIIHAEFVKDSDHEIKDNNLLLPFQDGVQSENIIIGNQVVSHDYTTNKVFVDGIERSIGESFILGGRNVSLARGSVVVILQDSLPRDFPRDGLQDEIGSNTGSLSVGDITTTNSYLLETKQVGSSTSISSYIYFTNSVTNQRICGIECIKTVDDGVTSTNAKINMGHLDDTNTRTVQDVLEYSHETTSVRSISQNLDENTTVVDIEGISFTSNSAALILGENAEFGIFYDDANDTLQIKHLDTLSGQYVTKREFTN